MFKRNNPEGFYGQQEMPKLSKAEVLFFGLLMSGAVKLENVPLPKSQDERCYVDTDDQKVMVPLHQNLMLLADLYEHCRRFACRREQEV